MMRDFLIGIVGNGFVGGATALFKCRDVDILIYDSLPEKCSKGVMSLKDIGAADIIFVCLPTPMDKDGECHTEIVRQSIIDIRNSGYKGSIIVRSTVPVGFCDENFVGFMPEFLTEANWQSDFKNTRTWVISGNNVDIERMTRLINLAFDNSVIETNLIDILTTKEAELLKYTRNCFLATKVSFFNEIYQYCQAQGVDYNKLIASVVKDDRIGRSHTSVPGPDGKFGLGGSCFPKDLASLKHQMIEKGTDPKIISAVIARNSEIDRPAKDWTDLKGRAVL